MTLFFKNEIIAEIYYSSTDSNICVVNNYLVNIYYVLITAVCYGLENTEPHHFYLTFFIFSVYYFKIMFPSPLFTNV
jgi:hypothetical protein